MAQGGDIDARLPLYTYLRPLIEGRRVLELGGGTRTGAEALSRLGAGSVVAVVDDGAPTGSTASNVRCLPTGTSFDALFSAGPFDVVMLPEAGLSLSPRGPMDLAALARLISPEGILVLSAPSEDQQTTSRRPPVGFTYYGLQDQLSAVFPNVRMFGQTAFSALGIAEFDADVADLTVNADLVDADAEEPSRYIALAGYVAGPSLGYALVQVPAMAVSATAVPAFPVRAEAVAPRTDPAALEVARKLTESQTQVAALDAKLLDAKGQAEGSARVARAQAEEIEELRARVRRAAETRVQLDEEVSRLRRALAEADESVMNLTRRTADEMSALAARLSSTIAPPAPPATEVRGSGSWRDTAVLADRLKQREAQLAQRESALFDRDERIAALEVEKQDLVWQLETSNSRAPVAVAAPIVVAAPVVVAPVVAAGPSPRERELKALLSSRERAIEEFHRAAAVHISEVDRLRSAVAEQSAHIVELEEALAEAESRLSAGLHDAERARVALVQAQEADRARRSRLSELEGTLLRMRHEASNRPKSDDADLVLARRQVLELETRLAMMEAAYRESEKGRTDATGRWNEAIERLTGLQEQSVAEREVVQQAQVVEQVARAAGEDVNRLRVALERSEDQLRKTRGQLLPLRGRVAMLEREKEARELAERDLVRSLLEEVGAIESGLREELGRIDDLTGAVMHVRGAADGPALDVSHSSE